MASFVENAVLSSDLPLYHFQKLVSIYIKIYFCAFQSVDFSLGLGASKTPCELCEMGISISYSTLGLLDVCPVGFPSSIHCGLIFPVQIPGARMPSVGHQPLTPPEVPVFSP